MHELTPERENRIREMAAVGLPNTKIALIEGVSVDWLERNARQVIEEGKARADIKLMKHLYERAFESDTMAIFLAKTRFGWKEINTIEHTGNIELGMLSAEPLTPEEWNNLYGSKNSLGTATRTTKSIN